MNWPAVHSAQRRDGPERVPFFVGRHRVGSVARQHLPLLHAWPAWLHLHNQALVLDSQDPTAALAHINAALRAQGVVRGWRNEPFALFGLEAVGDIGSDVSTHVSAHVSTDGDTNRDRNRCTNGGTRNSPSGGFGQGPCLARIERAAARFWGTLTRGAHATGFVADAAGRPTHLWLARRASSKATDPGMLDNLVGGGVPDGQTPWQALVREGWEEAGLAPAVMATARAGRVIRLHRGVAEGLQLEDVYSHDLQLRPDQTPVNQDGEVAGFICLPVQQALACAASGQMTVDAELVTLDFALRHGLCAAPAGALALMRGA